METHRVAFENLVWQTGPAGVRFKVYTRAGRKLRLLEFTRQLSHPDWCSNGHFGYVIEGELEIEFDTHVDRYCAGDGVFIPSGQADRHRPRAICDRAALIFVEDV